jgi:hypothetical protein
MFAVTAKYPVPSPQSATCHSYKISGANNCYKPKYPTQ